MLARRKPVEKSNLLVIDQENESEKSDDSVADKKNEANSQSSEESIDEKKGQSMKTRKNKQKNDSDTESDSSDKVDMRKKEKMKLKRVISESHPIFNRHLKAGMLRRNQKEKITLDPPEDEGEGQSENQTKPKLPKRFQRDPLKVFQNHRMPTAQLTQARDENEQNRLDARNYSTLSLPMMSYSYQNGDVRLDQRYSNYIRNVVFDYNQVRKKKFSEEFEQRKRIFEQQLYEYKVWVDEIDERNRLASLQNRPIPQYGTSPQYNLRTFKPYAPEPNPKFAWHSSMQYVPQNNNLQLYSQYSSPELNPSQQSQSKPKFLPLINPTKLGIMNEII